MTIFFAFVLSLLPPEDMDRFIDDLMKRMTLEEKIGQLNLPVTDCECKGNRLQTDYKLTLLPSNQDFLPAGQGSGKDIIISSLFQFQTFAKFRNR